MSLQSTHPLLKKIEHIGIAVADVDVSIERFSKLLQHSPYKIEEVISEGIKTIFFNIGESKIELLQALHEDSPIAKFISKKGEGIHHIAFEVDNIEQARKTLEADGFEFIGAIKQGADNKLVSFIHPKSAGKILVELVQDTK